MTSLVEISFGNVRPLSDEEREHPLCQKYGYKWTVIDPYVYKGGDNLQITVQVGFLSDGSSGGPDVGVSWIFHDWLYATHMLDDGTLCTREDADNIMAEILRRDNMPGYYSVFDWLRRWNVCWCFSRAWASSHVRGAQFLKDLESTPNQ